MKTKRFLCLFLAVAMLFTIIPLTAISTSATVTSVATTSYEGSGTENDPYIAMSSSDLAGFIHSDKNLHIKLGANITLSGSIFVESNITIDMNGYTITSNATSYAFRITQGHTLKIKGTGKIKYTDNLYIFYVDGTLETNGTVTYECPTKAGTIICTSDYGKVIINGGNFIGQQILINGVGKLYVYGGNFATEILINKTSNGYIYGGSFNGKIVNYNALRIYGGEFLKDVSSYGEGVTGIYAGYFKEGVSNNSSTNGSHILGEGSICLEHTKNTITETGVFICVEMTVYRPDFAKLSPELPEGQTEVDAGTINALDDYIVSFKAKDIPDVFVKNGFTIEEKLIVKDSDGNTLKENVDYTLSYSNNTNIGNASRICIVSDTNVWPIYGQTIINGLANAGFECCSFVFPAGEASKNGSTFLSLLNFLAENKLTRSDLIVALGGGVVGDLAGFAAATYLRGIRFIQVPTTLLAAVDSSVGGKTAIDLPEGKNLVGAFWQPSLVICDTDTLNTLPEDIFRDGCAEVIKYGILYDPDLFAELEHSGMGFDRESVIARCVELKRNVVMKDEFDTGARMKLNLGHTIGHGVEAKSQFTISHGKAVSIGIAIVCRAALCQDCQRILTLLWQFSLPIHTDYTAEDLYIHALSDKKRSGSTVNLIIPHGIGNCAITPMNVDQIKSFIEAGL